MTWKFGGTSSPRNMGIGDPQRGNSRKRERPNLWVEPSRSYGRRRSNGLAWFWVAAVVLVVGLIIVLGGNAFTPAAGAVTPSLPALTPVLTLNAANTIATPIGAVTMTTLVTPATAALSVTPSLPAVPVASPAAPFRVVIPADTDHVNVRSGPGLGYELLGQLNAGQSAPVTGKSGEGQWWQITFEDREGWVYTPLVQFEGDPDAVTVIATP